MIYVFARDRGDAAQWAKFQGYEGHEYHYVGQSWNLPGRLLDETDRIVRTALAGEHPAAAELERMLAAILAKTALTETKDGLLVRQVA